MTGSVVLADVGAAGSTAAVPDDAHRQGTKDLTKLGWGLLVGGSIGFVAAFVLVLVLEKIALLGDSDDVPSCSINPVLNCGSVMTTAQAEVVGFLNPLLGVASFPLLMATGAALLAGARPARWYWWGLQAGVALGAVFVGWLVIQSLYRIGALCPYCMVVWAVVVPTSWYVTLHNLQSGVLGSRVARSATVRRLRDGHALVLTLVLLFVLGLALERFWSYWVTLV